MYENERMQIHKPINTSEYRDEHRSLSGTREYDGGPIRQNLDAGEQSKKKHESEVARLMRRDFAETGFQDRQQNPPAGAPPENSEYTNLSSRQRKKLAARRAKSLKQARKKYGEDATEDTLPMVARLREHSKKQNDALPPWQGEPPESAEIALSELEVDGDIFSKPCEGTAFDIKGALAKNQEMKDLLYHFNSMGESIDSLPPLTRFRIGELRSMQECMERALMVMFAANGINYSTGGRTRPREVREAKAKKAAALADFRKMAEGRREAVMGSLEKLSEEKVQDKMTARRDLILKKQKDDDLDMPLAFFYDMASPELIWEITDGIKSNPENYAEWKEEIDRMFEDFIDANRRLSEMNLRAQAFMDLGMEAFTKGDEDAGHLYKDISDRIRLGPAYKAMIGRIAALGTMIRYMAEDREKGMEAWMHTALEDEYGVVTEERGRQKEAIASLDLMEEKNREFEAENARLEAEKERRLEADRKFKEKFPFCDEHGAAISDALRLEVKRHNNPLEDSAEMRKTLPVKMDIRVLRTFCSGYDVGADGEPLTAADAEKKERDMRFIRDYCSGDKALCSPHLERITREMLDFSPTPEMLTPEYMNGHAAELKEICDKMVYFENIIKDNKEYFNGLPKGDMDIINARFPELWTHFSDYIMQSLASRGVAVNSGKLFKADAKEFVDTARENFEGALVNVSNAINARAHKIG
jgi:hypothetical protein